MFVVNPPLAAIALAPVPFVVFVAARYGRRSRPALQEVQQRIAELTAEVEENVSGVRVVKAFAREDAPAPRASSARSAASSTSRCSRRGCRPSTSPFIGFLPQLGLAAVLLVGGRQVIDGTITLGALHRLLHLPADADRRRCACSACRSGMAQRATASGARLFEILDREPQITAPPGRRAAARRRRAASSCAA